MPKKIILVRHGETDYNLKKMFQGWLDIFLNEKGVWQAKRLAKRLKKEKVDAIYSSDLKRAYQTAWEIGKMLRLKIKKTKLIRERNMGVFQGKKWDYVENRMRDLFFKFRNEKDFRGHNGESVSDVYKRIEKLVNKLKKEHKDEVVLLSTHGGTKRKLLRFFNVIKREDRPFLNNASVSILERDKNGDYKMSVLNDTKHLMTRT